MIATFSQRPALPSNMKKAKIYERASYLEIDPEYAKCLPIREGDEVKKTCITSIPSPFISIFKLNSYHFNWRWYNIIWPFLPETCHMTYNPEIVLDHKCVSITTIVVFLFYVLIKRNNIINLKHWMVTRIAKITSTFMLGMSDWSS